MWEVHSLWGGQNFYVAKIDGIVSFDGGLLNTYNIVVVSMQLSPKFLPVFIDEQKISIT